MRSTRAASRKARELKPRALDWRYPRELRKPPSRCVFNVWQMNSTEKRFRCSSMNRIISDVLGRVRMRKKLRRLSTTHWCPAALDSLDATVRFLQQGPRALIPQHVLRDERPASIASLCATKAQLWCHDLAGFLHRNILRQNASFHEADHTVLRLLIKLLRHVRRFSHLLKRNKTWDTSNAQ